VGALAAHLGVGFDGEFYTAPDANAAAALLPGLLRAGDTVLVKGSRGVRLELIAQALAEPGERPALSGGEPSAHGLAADARR
jgi:UDP-N-acetylmuramyl pentapeptide synthase